MPPLHRPICAFLGVGVPRLDDAGQRAVAVDHQPAVGCRVGRPHAGDRHRNLRLLPPRREQAAIVSVRKQRRVAEQHQHISDRCLRPGDAASAVRAARTASPVPRGGYCVTVSAGATAARPNPCRARSRRPSRPVPAARSASMTWRIIACPATSCSTLGRVDLRRVPSPAARMMAAKRGRLMAGLATNETRSSEKVCTRTASCQHTDCCGI